MLRSLRYIVEILAALVGVAVVCGILLAWRLSTMPTDSNFLKPYIEAGIESTLSGSKVHLETSTLSWNGTERAFAVHAQNIRINNVVGREIASIPTVDAKISLFGLLFGHLMPRELTIDHPQIKLARDKGGVFIFSEGAVGETSDDASSDMADTVVNTIATYLSHATFMHQLAVTQAVFDVYDEKSQKTWSVSVPEISIKRNGIGNFNRALRFGALNGRLTIEIAQKDSPTSLDVNYIYDPSLQQHSLESSFKNVTPALIAGGNLAALGVDAAAIMALPLTGKAELTFDKSLTLVKVAAQIHGGEGRLIYADFWDNPCPIKSLDADAKYNRVTRRLTLSDLRVDFNGPTLALKVDSVPAQQSGQDIDYTAEIKVDNLPMNKFDALWPKPAMPNPRYWLTANLHNGTFEHAEVTLKGGAAFDNLTNPSITEGQGKISASGASVTYIESMPSVEGVGATATFDLNKMDVQITEGGIGNIRLSPFTLQITGLSDVDQIIDIPMKVSGPLPEVLQLLDHPPMNYAKALGLSPADLGGNIEGLVSFRFPLLKSLAVKDIDIHATAEATSVASTKLIPGIPIDQGKLNLDLNTSGFTLKGSVALGKAPFDIVWQENFEQKEDKPLRQVSAEGAIRDDQWNNLGISAFNGTKGAVNVSVRMTRLTKNKTTYSGTLDMTPAALNVDMLKWKKPANLPATLKFAAEAVAEKPVVVSSIMLQGTRVSAKGDAVLSPDMSQLLSLNFAPLILGRTDASLRFTQDFGDKGALRFDAKGKSLDVSGLRGGNDPERNDPRPKEYHIDVDRLYTSDIGRMDKAKGFAARDKNGWREINLRGLADGDTPLSMELTPKADGTRTFKIESNSFGKAMKGLGFTDTVKNGKLVVTGQSTRENPRVIKGSVKVGKFTVEKLPVLALLLNATSPFGFAGILTDSADFSRLKGDFVWQGDEITLTRANAAGSAFGININGKIDMNSGDANLQGTLVPFSVINSVLNRIPIIGDILTGGKDQGVLAVAYEINGNLSSPKISVNPVSLLTPGFIRNLFFHDDETDDGE